MVGVSFYSPLLGAAVCLPDAGLAAIAACAAPLSAPCAGSAVELLGPASPFCSFPSWHVVPSACARACLHHHRGGQDTLRVLATSRRCYQVAWCIPQGVRLGSAVGRRIYSLLERAEAASAWGCVGAVFVFAISAPLDRLRPPLELWHLTRPAWKHQQVLGVLTLPATSVRPWR